MLDERNLVAKTVRVHVWATLCLVLGLERLTYMPIRPTLPMHVSTPGVRSSPPSNASVGDPGTAEVERKSDRLLPSKVRHSAGDLQLAEFASRRDL